MPIATANGIRIHYDTFGNKTDCPILLIAGLSCQMICWDDVLLHRLASKGFFVIRFDNRDIGLSEKMDDAGLPNISEVMTTTLAGGRPKVAYTLDDMAKDAFGLLDAIGIDGAHFCGISMGGMIAQTAALLYPKRVSSLTSIFSTTGNPKIATPTPEAQKVLFTPPPHELNAFIDHFINTYKTIFGTQYAFDEAWHRETARRSFERSAYALGIARQFAAIIASGDRTTALQSLKMPTLVIHGTADPLVPVICGKETARAVPGARLVLIDGMGHDLPHDGAWPEIMDMVATHAKAATVD